MTRSLFQSCCVLLCLLSSTNGSELEGLIKSRATLVFQDNFSRNESDDTREQLGDNWITNSKGRADGAKQADLNDGRLVITRARHANHGVSIKHEQPFNNGVVRLRFKLLNKSGLSLLFHDPACQEVVAGHICHVKVTPTSIRLSDDKLGRYSQAVKQKKAAGIPKAEINQAIKDTTVSIRTNLPIGKWHQMALVIDGERMTVFINGQSQRMLKSPGIAHSPKRNFAIGVPQKVEVDDVELFLLKQDRTK